jgi:protein arginine N-methyltransferase 1
VAHEIVEANGLGDRIVFIQATSTAVSLPEPVDLVITDVRGALPMFGRSLATMIDARRFLAGAGVIIPAEDIVRGAVVELAQEHDALTRPWRHGTFGFDVSAAERMVLNTWAKACIPQSALLTAPADLVHLDYARLDTPHVAGTFVTAVTRQGIAHGLAVWFDTRLFADAGFSNAPGRPSTVYGQGFFPLSSPVAVAPGDEVIVELRATLVHEEYVWRWGTTVRSPGGAVKGRREQSTFHGAPLCADRLRALHAEAMPALGVEAAIDRFVLERLDGGTTLAAVAGALCARFPDRFDGLPSALARVTDVAAAYVR